MRIVGIMAGVALAAAGCSGSGSSSSSGGTNSGSGSSITGEFAFTPEATLARAGTESLDDGGSRDTEHVYITTLNSGCDKLPADGHIDHGFLEEYVEFTVAGNPHLAPGSYGTDAGESIYLSSEVLTGPNEFQISINDENSVTLTTVSDSAFEGSFTTAVDLGDGGRSALGGTFKATVCK